MSNATATSIAMLGGTANATANANGGTSFGGFYGGNAGSATATATATAMLGGAANASATATGGNPGTLFGVTGGAGAANANSFATTINGSMAKAQSIAIGTGAGQAQATAQTNFGNFSSVQAVAISPVSGTTPANAIAQAGGGISLSSPVNPGQSFSFVSGSGLGPLTLAAGTMGAGYGGTGAPLTYQESASFTQNGGLFLLDLLFNNALGTGFDGALFEVSLNGNVVDSQSFTDLTSAESFFSNNLIDVPLVAGQDFIQILFSETMGSSSGQGFSFDYALADVAATPLPPAWTMMLIGLAGIGFVTHRRRKQNTALAVDSSLAFAQLGAPAFADQ
jgi:hypothetical protein